MTNCRLTVLGVCTGILKYCQRVKEHQARLFKVDTVLELVEVRLLDIPNEPLLIVKKLKIHTAIVYTLYSRGQD